MILVLSACVGLPGLIFRVSLIPFVLNFSTDNLLPKSLPAVASGGPLPNGTSFLSGVFGLNLVVGSARLVPGIRSPRCAKRLGLCTDLCLLFFFTGFP